MSRRATAVAIGLGLALCLGIAVFAAPWASSSPDGLERVAIDEGFDSEASEHALADSPAADYSTGPWRALGVVLVFVVVIGATTVARQWRSGANDVVT